MPACGRARGPPVCGWFGCDRTRPRTARTAGTSSPRRRSRGHHGRGDAGLGARRDAVRTLPGARRVADTAALLSSDRAGALTGAEANLTAARWLTDRSSIAQPPARTQDDAGFVARQRARYAACVNRRRPARRTMQIGPTRAPPPDWERSQAAALCRRATGKRAPLAGDPHAAPLPRPANTTTLPSARDSSASARQSSHSLSQCAVAGSDHDGPRRHRRSGELVGEAPLHARAVDVEARAEIPPAPAS
jgi:hypothetical protein